MKKILLLLIATSSCASLMGMEKKQKQIIPVTPPPVYAPQDPSIQAPLPPMRHEVQAYNDFLDVRWAATLEVMRGVAERTEEREERCRAIAQCAQSCPLKTLATVTCVIACPLAIVGDTITCCSCPHVCNRFEITRPCYTAILKTERCYPLSCYPGCDCPPCCDPCCPHPDPRTMNILERPWSRHYIPCTNTVYANWLHFICNNE